MLTSVMVKQYVYTYRNKAKCMIMFPRYHRGFSLFKVVLYPQSRLAETPADPESCAVYLAYSVTLLHHGCVLHTVVPGVPWGHAHSALPTYSLFGGMYDYLKETEFELQ